MYCFFLENTLYMYIEFDNSNYTRCLAVSILTAFKIQMSTVSIHCAPEMSEIDCIGRIESFWPKFVKGW